MKIKDNFWIGLGLGVAIYALVGFLLSLIPWGESVPANTPFLLASFPGIILFRMCLVKWKKESLGKGIMLVTILALFVILILTLR
ncbi:MAG: hypothetical protein MJZ94_05965 [Bacteroidales bacterium]|nr:hypothetical protein [Bacteroidales bacterium]